jgi:hypothetical protein
MKPVDEEFVVYIGVPELHPPVRESRVMTRADAEQFASELRAQTTFLGARITGVHVGLRSKDMTVPAQRGTRGRTQSTTHYMPNNRRNVRASSGRWRGETSGSHWERTSTEHRPQYIESGLRKGWAL